MWTNVKLIMETANIFVITTKEATRVLVIQEIDWLATVTVVKVKGLLILIFITFK